MRHICKIFILLFSLQVSGQNYSSTEYLGTVLEDLKKIETASYYSHIHKWHYGSKEPEVLDALLLQTYRNRADSLNLGVSYIRFDSVTNELINCYDGKMSASVSNEDHVVVIDSFKIRRAPFRILSNPFFNLVENILEYTLTTNDSVTKEFEDRGGDLFFRLTINEKMQVEFQGRPCYIPENPYTIDPTSVYEVIIDKKSGLPYRYKRIMEHDTTGEEVAGVKINELNHDDFVAVKYLPNGMPVRNYGEPNREKKGISVLNTQAPQWTLLNADNDTCRLSDLKSKVVMIQFTSIYCGPCRVSVPALNNLSNDYQKEDFDFVAIECSGSGLKALCNYKEKSDIKYKLLESQKSVLNDYIISSYPQFLFLDENRKIVKIYKGFSQGKSEKEIKEIINAMLKGDA